MITIKYDKNGTPIADMQAEDFVRQLLDGAKVSVSTGNVIEAARCLVKEEGLEVQFEFEGEILTPNKDGRFLHWPDGFCDYWDGWLGRLL
jgi:hypothetical protein